MFYEICNKINISFIQKALKDKLAYMIKSKSQNNYYHDYKIYIRRGECCLGPKYN